MIPGMEKEWLLGEFKRRKRENAAYSLRTFSRVVNVSPGRLSEYLAGKRPVTQKMARKMADRLGAIAPAGTGFEMEQLGEEVFAAVAEPRHLALLSLLETKDFRPDVRWMADRLGIEPAVARDAMERLIRLGLARLEGDTIVPTKKNLTTTNDVASVALRQSHRASLEHAIDTLDTVPVGERDVSSVTMAIDVQQLPLAKEAIRVFRRRLMRLLEAGNADEVYELNIQLVPVTRKIRSERRDGVEG